MQIAGDVWLSEQLLVLLVDMCKPCSHIHWDQPHLFPLIDISSSVQSAVADLCIARFNVSSRRKTKLIYFTTYSLPHTVYLSFYFILLWHHCAVLLLIRTVWSSLSLRLRSDRSCFSELSGFSCDFSGLEGLEGPASEVSPEQLGKLLASDGAGDTRALFFTRVDNTEQKRVKLGLNQD